MEIESVYHIFLLSDTKFSPIVITFIDDSGASLPISLIVICSILRAELPESVSEKCVSKWTSCHLPDILLFSCYTRLEVTGRKEMGPGGALWHCHFLDTEQPRLEETLVKEPGGHKRKKKAWKGKIQPIKALWPIKS